MAAGPIVMRAIAEAVQETLGPDMGFVVLVYRHNNDKPGVNYASNSKREDVIRFLREAAVKLEKEEIRGMSEL